MPAFQPFVMEQMMSEWENVVDVNLSESGVHQMTFGELLAMDGREPNDLAGIGMFYPQANGTPELRETIAALYPGAARDDVLVTIGAAEANYLAVTTFLDPGDEVFTSRQRRENGLGILAAAERTASAPGAPV